MRRGSRAGFSLIELIISVVLGSLVMAGLFGIMSSAIRMQAEGLRKGSVTGWSLAGIVRMNKEIENANVLVWPTNVGAGGAPGTASNWLVGCTNWSVLGGGRIDTSQPATVFYYCYDGQDSYDDDGVNGLLRRYANVGAGVTCPGAGAYPGALPPCNGGGAFTQNDVIAVGVNYHSALSPTGVFRRDETLRGVRMQFVIGNPTPPNTPAAGQADIRNKQVLEFNTAITLTRNYN